MKPAPRPSYRQTLLPAAAILLLWMAHAWIAPAAAAAPKYSVEEMRALDSRMAAWVQALRDNDAKAFLAFFSETRPWRYLSTLPGEKHADTITFQRLKADLERKKGWFEVLFDGGGDDVFRDHVLNDGGRPWRRWLLSFSPPDSESRDDVYVRWRNEEGSWVIDVIAEPSS
jgi:hypothetical protein